MPNPNNAETIPGNGVSSSTAKRKSAPRKTSAPGATSATRSASKKGSAPSTDKEILFKDEPNPYRQPEPPFIWIDHPSDGERLFGPEYVIRLGVGGAEAVELSIDKGAWQPCRLTSGYWWFDWANIAPGKHTLTARMRTTDGRWYRTPTRTCDYRR